MSATKTEAGNAICEDCRKLLEFARKNIAAISDRDGRLLAGLYDRKHRDQVYAVLCELIDHLASCRCSDDLPGQNPIVLNLRDETFCALAGIYERVGDPLRLSYHFLEAVRDFFKMLICRDLSIAKMARTHSLCGISKLALRTALRLCHWQMTGQSWVSGYLTSKYSEDSVPSEADFGNVSKTPRPRDTIWMKREIELVERYAREHDVKPEHAAITVWDANEGEFRAASYLHIKVRGFKSGNALRAHFCL